MSSMNAFDPTCLFSSDLLQLFPSILDDNSASIAALWTQESLSSYRSNLDDVTVPTLPENSCSDHSSTPMSSPVFGGSGPAAIFSDQVLFEVPSVNNVPVMSPEFDDTLGGLFTGSTTSISRSNIIVADNNNNGAIVKDSDDSVHDQFLQQETYVRENYHAHHHQFMSNNQFFPDFQPLIYTQSDGPNWAIQGRTPGNMEEATVKVRPYSVEERKDRILKYLKKRNQRNFNKTIKYACRKTLADRRIRVRGRFARNNEVGEESMVAMKNENNNNKNSNSNNNNQEDEECYYDGSIEDKDNIGEEWLQEAVTSLMYLPIFAG